MLLTEIFDHLSYGELSQLFVGGSIASVNTDGIPVDAYPRIVSFINLALIDLYKRFPLKENKFTLQQYESINRYQLKIAFALSNVTSVEPIKYIIDSASAPFADDVLLINRILNPDGVPYALNDIHNPDSLYTPEDKVLLINTPVDATLNTIEYRCYPEKVVLVDNDIEGVEVNLPDSLVAALLAYIGFRAHIALPEGDAAKSTGFFSKYKKICDEINEFGLLNKPAPTCNRFEANGWV